MFVRFWCVDLAQSGPVHVGLPGAGIDRADGVAGDIGIVQGIEVEINAFEGAQPVGQGAQQVCKLARFGLRLSHTDRLEPERVPRGGLREPPEIGGNHRRDLGVAAAGAAVRHQHDRLAVAGHLQAAVHSAVGNDVVAVQMLQHGTLEPVAHAVARGRYLPRAVDKQLFGLVGEFVVLRAPDHADRCIARRGRQFDPLFRRAAGGLGLQFVARLQRPRIGAAEPGARVDGEAAEHRLALRCRPRSRGS